MLKAPVAGNVKTRLGADIGVGRATSLFRVMTQNTIKRVDRPLWRTVLAVDPPSSLGIRTPYWPDHLARIDQVKGDLGARMSAALKTAPKGLVILIGADATGLRADHIRQAFFRLRGADLVVGPAKDGGYWLIGVSGRRTFPTLFENVRWSSEYTLGDTLKNLPSEAKVTMLEELSDIDHAEDLSAMELRSVS